MTDKEKLRKLKKELAELEAKKKELEQEIKEETHRVFLPPEPVKKFQKIEPVKEDYTDLESKINYLMLHEGNQKALSDRLGISSSYLSKIRTGSRSGGKYRKKIRDMFYYEHRKAQKEAIPTIPTKELRKRSREKGSWEAGLKSAKWKKLYRWYAMFNVTKLYNLDTGLPIGGGVYSIKVVTDDLDLSQEDIPLYEERTLPRTVSLKKGITAFNLNELMETWQDLVIEREKELWQEPGVLNVEFKYIFRHYREYEKGEPILKRKDKK